MLAVKSIGIKAAERLAGHGNEWGVGQRLVLGHGSDGGTPLTFPLQADP